MKSVELINTTTKESFILSEDSFVYVLETLRWDPVKASQNSVKFTNLIGSRVTSISLEPRDIYIVGWVVADDRDEMDQRKKPLNKFINPLQKYILKYGDYFLEFYPDSSIQYGEDYSENNEILCKFLIQGSCENPLFSLYNKKSADITSLAKVPVKVFPMVIPQNGGMIFGVTPGVNYATVYNEGDVEVGMIVTMTATYGDVINPILHREGSSDILKIEIDLKQGQTIKLNTTFGNEYLTLVSTDGTETDIFNRLTKESVLFGFPQGETILYFEADGNSSNLSYEVDYYPNFLEVE